MEKKFILKESGEPVEFGDTIEFTLVKELENGDKVKKQVSCKFVPDILPLLLAEDVVCEVEAKHKPIQFDSLDDEDDDEEDGNEEEEDASLDDVLDAIIDTLGTQSECIKRLYDRVHELERKNLAAAGISVKDLPRPLHNWVYSPDHITVCECTMF